ncbi:hypothetical protein [Aeribacillus pallidus]
MESSTTIVKRHAAPKDRLLNMEASDMLASIEFLGKKGFPIVAKKIKVL